MGELDLENLEAAVEEDQTEAAAAAFQVVAYLA